jgi:hypothetical protein
MNSVLAAGTPAGGRLLAHNAMSGATHEKLAKWL